MSAIIGFDEAQATIVNQAGEALVLKSIVITGELNGAMFEAHVRQTFSNPSATHAEVVYSFPLPWGATLLGVQAQLGAVKLQGAVIAKIQAQEQYEDTLTQGDAAIMLEQGRDGQYVLHLGNLAPGEECLIDLHYGQLLRFEQGGLRLVIPTVIAPRYGDALNKGGLAPYQIPETDFLAEYDFRLTMHLYGDLLKARIASPSHLISMRTDFTNQKMTIALAKQSYLDRDFILVLDQLAQNSIVTTAPDFKDPETFIATASFSPRITDAKINKINIKILVDCSGSMAGASMIAARRALIAVIRKLKKDDKFSLSKFGSDVEHRSRSLWSMTERSLLSAEKWITELDASMGGTEMLTALESTLALPCSEPCDVLLITDGAIYDVSSVIAKAKVSSHRVFSVGIGSSPSQNLLHSLGLKTGGACDFVASGEVVEPAILRMFARLRSAQISNLSVQWPDHCLPTFTNKLSGTSFDGDTLHASAWFSKKPTGPIRLMGHVAGKQELQELGCVDISDDPGSAPTSTNTLEFSGLSRLAAQERLRGDGLEEFEKNNLAIDYQLITESTSFLLIHERSEKEKAKDMPVLSKVNQMLPAGWGGTSDEKIYALKKSAEDIPIAYCVRRMAYVPGSVSFTASSDHYEIPSFLRRNSDIDKSSEDEDQPLTIKPNQIWLKVNDAQEKIWVLLAANPDSPGIRIWVTDAQYEVFDVMDFETIEHARSELKLNGFSIYDKKRFLLKRLFKNSYVRKNVTVTSTDTHSNTWLKA